MDSYLREFEEVTPEEAIKKPSWWKMLINIFFQGGSTMTQCPICDSKFDEDKEGDVCDKCDKDVCPDCFNEDTDLCKNCEG